MNEIYKPLKFTTMFCPKHGDTKFRYNAKKGRKSGQYHCMQCQSEYAVLQKQRRKLELVTLKGGKCEICGYSKNLSALEFHHKDPNEKEFNISKSMRSREETLKELDKCTLVCSNCHHEIHNPKATKENVEEVIHLHNVYIEEKNNTYNRAVKNRELFKDIDSKIIELGDLKSVSEFYGVSISTIKRYKTTKPKTSRIPKNDIDSIVMEIKNGKSTKEIGEKYDVSSRYVTSFLNKRGITIKGIKKLND